MLNSSQIAQRLGFAKKADEMPFEDPKPPKSPKPSAGNVGPEQAPDKLELPENLGGQPAEADPLTAGPPVDPTTADPASNPPPAPPLPPAPPAAADKIERLRQVLLEAIGEEDDD